MQPKKPARLEVPRPQGPPEEGFLGRVVQARERDAEPAPVPLDVPPHVRRAAHRHERHAASPRSTPRIAATARRARTSLTPSTSTAARISASGSTSIGPSSSPCRRGSARRARSRCRPRRRRRPATWHDFRCRRRRARPGRWSSASGGRGWRRGRAPGQAARPRAAAPPDVAGGRAGRRGGWTSTTRRRPAPDGRRVTADDVRGQLDADSKGRYELADGRIRAAQGHSAASSSAWNRVPPPSCSITAPWSGSCRRSSRRASAAFPAVRAPQPGRGHRGADRTAPRRARRPRGGRRRGARGGARVPPGVERGLADRRRAAPLPAPAHLTVVQDRALRRYSTSPAMPSNGVSTMTSQPASRQAAATSSGSIVPES